MRLNEIAGTRFQDDLANLLKVMQGRANSKKTQSMLTWPALNHMLLSYGHGEVDQEMLDKIKSQIDPSGAIIQDVNEKGVVLKTDENTPEEPTLAAGLPTARSVDQMASRAASKDLQ